MKEKLQELYLKLIALSDLNFKLSNEDYMKVLHRELLSKSEAFEGAADCVLDKFRDIIIPKDTIRFKSIRRDNLEEMAADEKSDNE